MKKIVAAFLIWRTLLFLIAAVSPVFIPKFGATFPYYQERLISSGLPQWIWSFGNFDGVHYLGIAKAGYSAQFTQAFFPLYPILIKLFSYLTLGNLLISALLISNITFLGSLLVFYKLVVQKYGEKIAFWSILFILCFPTSFFFGSVYTESIFLLLLSSTFYFSSKNKIFLASVTGAVASFTRIMGIFLAPALFYSKKNLRLLPLLIVPLGLIMYMIYLKIEFNNPLYFLTAQSDFGQSRQTSSIVLLPQVFYRYFKILQTTSGLLFYNALLELSATLFALTVLLVKVKKINRDWLIFSLPALILPTITGTLASMPRYILLVFPIYIVLAQINSTVIKIGILSIFSILGAVLLALFSQGYWVA